ncbi:uncharacterized protein LOC124260787 [Haliotis rubra]|uniref:uncharacterized protein LOC124260787 n=1 Tax=Haliotis rubra TaxID=36100 RepID=UPI001EE5D863|nr:uncharacterized protein LOC124260787 [Haliotis rubra]
MAVQCAQCSKTDILAEEREVEDPPYTLVLDGSQKSKPKLVDRNVFTYVIKVLLHLNPIISTILYLDISIFNVIVFDVILTLYYYIFQQVTQNKIYYRCSKRPCKATVVETKSTGDSAPGKHNHSHTAEAGKIVSVQVRAQVKRTATQDLFKSARSIAEDVTSDMVDPILPSGSRDNPEYLARIANRCRENLRPKNLR